MAQAKVLNFAYGSNMLLSRIRERVSSARSLGTAVLKGHQLRWHKASKDGSGKCDVIRSDSVDATVHGVLYEIAQHEKVELDAAEGLGNGYDEKQVGVIFSGQVVIATVYYATNINAGLKPYKWYRDLVVAGARENGLPDAYIAALEDAEVINDQDDARHARNMVLILHQTKTQGVLAPTIYRLCIERFRGLKKLIWHPGPGVNLILGGGDVGKTTILDAIGLLFSPTNSTVVLDTDYNLREDKAGFIIEAIIALPSGSGINQLTRPAWPWSWDGRDAVVPDHADDLASPGEEVYRLRLCGTSDLELSYEIVQPNNTTDHFPVALRRAIGLVRLSGDDRNDRDLRLVQGSALDRLLSDKGLRSRMASELAKRSVYNELGDDARSALIDLDKAFRAQNLPGDLDIAMTGGQGASIASLVGLTAKREAVQLPLSSWGSGTRRLSALAIAEHIQGECPLMIVDEVERGLEPYRQRLLMTKLQAGKSQTFITTHSPTAISAASHARLWYVDHAGNIGKLDGTKVAALREQDPETFLARLAIVAEGVTEVGFAVALLERSLRSTIRLHGIHVADGGGHDTTIAVLEALAEGGLLFGGFADDEGRHPTRWAAVRQHLGNLLFRWKTGDIESNVMTAVPDGSLEMLLSDPAGQKTGLRLRTLADRLSIENKDFASVSAKASVGLRQLMIDAARGTVPIGIEGRKKEFKNHSQAWFKSVAGGRELAEKVFALGAWPTLKDELLPFCSAVCNVAGVEPLDDLEA